jgi:hypothetical protein
LFCLLCLPCKFNDKSIWTHETDLICMISWLLHFLKYLDLYAPTIWCAHTSRAGHISAAAVLYALACVLLNII